MLLDESGDILCKSYQLSNGNPIRDTIEMFENLRGQVEAQNAKLEVLGVATTGYAKDILKDVLNADVALVETVAHTESALKFYEDPHVIVDVGGQDIKIIILHNGRVKDFKLNYFLQRYREEVIRKRQAGQDIEAQLAALEAQLRREGGEVDMPPVGQESWEGAEEMAAGD